MAQYKKKPVVIEAIQLQPNFDTLHKVEEFISGLRIEFENKISSDKFEEYYLGIIGNGGRTIKTLEGEMKASFGDWIIKGVNGEFYPCKPDIFEKTYEAVV